MKIIDYGAIHKRRHQFFEIFDPPPPCEQISTNDKRPS